MSGEHLSRSHAESQYFMPSKSYHLVIDLQMRRRTDYIVHRVGKIVQVMRVQPGHGDSSILSLRKQLVSINQLSASGSRTHHIHVPLLPQRHHLLFSQSGEREHANLVCDMIPCSWSAFGLEARTQALTHLDDAAAHRAQILLPLGKELGIIQNDASDASTVSRGIGDLRPLQNGKLARDVLDRLHGVRSRSSDEVEGARTLTVEAKVLRKGLRDACLEPQRDKVPNGPGVTLEIARCEALVSAVKEREVVA